MYSPIKIWRRQRKLREHIGKKGKIITWTRIYVGGEGFNQETPYYVALVELENNIKLTLQVADWDKELSFDQEVRIVLRKLHQKTDDGVIAYGIKCVLL